MTDGIPNPITCGYCNKINPADLKHCWYCRKLVRGVYSDKMAL